ncbi:hypothetical protein [Methyloglobulus morosus]|uniref:hypothetical protein n=1 Tax=Methyloglobulus morosus TaxID=1410681 RepID=UPI00041E5364|nr:hypothetical protein [Methyloglobulus morosus]
MRQSADGKTGFGTSSTREISRYNRQGKEAGCKRGTFEQLLGNRTACKKKSLNMRIQIAFADIF